MSDEPEELIGTVSMADAGDNADGAEDDGGAVDGGGVGEGEEASSHAAPSAAYSADANIGAKLFKKIRYVFLQPRKRTTKLCTAPSLTHSV